MIKGKPPFPFKTIALGVAFSPNLAELVAETKRLCRIHNAGAIFIHVGKKTSEKQRTLTELLLQSEFNDGNSRIYWEPDEAVTSFLRICKHEVVDLLIVGASERNNFSPPAGKLMRTLAVKSKCSLLIFAKPPSGGFKKIGVGNSDSRKMELTIQTAMYFAEKENISEVLFIDESVNPDPEQSNPFENLFQNDAGNTLTETKINIRTVWLIDENCSTISEFAFRNKLDLLAVNSTDHSFLIFDRIPGKDKIEYLLNELKTNLLIVHARLPK